MNRRFNSDSYNRIFILGAKTLEPENLRLAFEEFGTITDVRMIKDRITGDNKGISYITFEKASEAALAIEKMNGQFISDLAKPIKVLLANDRSEGNVRDPEEEDKMKRLFIVVPTGKTENEIRCHFEKFGRVDYVKILRKNSREVQLAYVKFASAHHAALALENCDQAYKAKFAETKWNTRLTRGEYHRRESSPHRDGDGPHAKRYRDDYEKLNLRNWEGRDTGPRGHAFFVKMSPHLSPTQVFKLFDIQPGLESCEYDPQTGLAHGCYVDYPFLERAREKLRLFEYPPGCKIQFNDSKGFPFEGTPIRQDNSGPSMEDNFKALIHTIEKAAAVIQNSSFTYGNPATHGNESYKKGESPHSNPRHCPTALLEAPIIEQLHFTSAPDLIPLDILTSAFYQFGNLVKVEYVPGSSFGFASFTSFESAGNALKSLNNQVMFGNRLKIYHNSQPRNDRRSRSLSREAVQQID